MHHCKSAKKTAHTCRWNIHQKLNESEHYALRSKINGHAYPHWNSVIHNNSAEESIIRTTCPSSSNHEVKLEHSGHFKHKWESIHQVIKLGDAVEYHEEDKAETEKSVPSRRICCDQLKCFAEGLR
jgi:hypothetical protein